MSEPLRVFTAIRHSHDPAFYYGGLWSANFYPALRELECEIIESQVDLLPASEFMGVARGFTLEQAEIRTTITERILTELKAEHTRQPIDLFLSYFYNAHFDPTGFQEIERLGIPSVNFFCNSIHQFELVADIAPHVRWSWHPEKEARRSYLAVGARPVWVQMGADPQLNHPLSQVVRKPRCCFVGQRYADRDAWVAALLRADVPLDLYGQGWAMKNSEPTTPKILTAEGAEKKSSLPVPGSRQAYWALAQEILATEGWWNGSRRVMRQAFHYLQSRRWRPRIAQASRGACSSMNETFADYEVVLNFSNVWADGRPGSALVPHVRLRDFEALMSRSCYLTGHTEEITEFYEIGQEIETYRDPAELVDKARFYLQHPEKAERLREAGYQRARRDHTWKNRFQELLQKIGHIDSKS